MKLILNHFDGSLLSLFIPYVQLINVNYISTDEIEEKAFSIPEIDRFERLS